MMINVYTFITRDLPIKGTFKIMTKQSSKTTEFMQSS